MSMIPETDSGTHVPNYDDIPLGDLRTSLASGKVPEVVAAAPADPAAAAPAAAETPVDQNAEPDPAQAGEEAKPDEAAVEEPVAEEVPDKEAAPASDIEAQVAAFKFTENADAETLAQEEAAFLELVELSEPIKLMLDRRDARIAELAAAAPDVALVEVSALQREHDQAFDALVTFRQTEKGDFVPDTAPIRELLATRYPQESEQLVVDILTEPSSKYAGYTRYQEYIRDMGGLGDSEMQFLTNYLENGGKIPTPTYTPEGIDPKVGEAYWTNPERETIADRVQQAQFTIVNPRATEEEIADAKTTLARVNQNLAIIQKGIDADAKEKQGVQTNADAGIRQIRSEGATAYTRTTLGLMQQHQDDLAAKLTMFDEPAAKVTAASFSMLINAALSDANEYAKAAQQQLASQGIKIDWNAASGALGRLYTQEQQIIALEKRGANPRAVEIAKGEKQRIILEIKGLEKNVTGQIVKTLTTGAGTALKANLEKAPKVPAARARVNGTGSPIGTKPNYDEMPLKQLREVAFGNAPLESLAP